MQSPKRWLDRRRGLSVTAHDSPLQVLRWGPTTALVVLVVVCGGVAAMWLLGVWSVPGTPTEADKLRLDRIKTALTVAAGLAAGVTLLLTLRRQMLSERGQRFAESEALEQRTTALYVAAAEQLGSDKAAVRLAGLYALERLGQDNPKLRQTVVDVWCAYLRMPYIPPTDVLTRNSERSPDRPSDNPQPPDAVLESERREELQVRLTAQRLLAAHTSGDLAEAGEATYWLGHRNKHIVIDLVGAVLVDFALATCRVGRCNLSGAQFHGDAHLTEAQFHGDAYLNGAQFHGKVNLSKAQSHCDAHLSEAQFRGGVFLAGVQFRGDVYLDEAQFHGGAFLEKTQFHGDAYLRAARFYGGAHLIGTQFHREADLSEAQFHEAANLSETQFHNDANLDAVKVRGAAFMLATQFHSAASLRDMQFHGDAYLNGAQFSRLADLSGSSATSKAILPKGWKLSDDAESVEGLFPVISAMDAASVPVDGAGGSAAPR